MSGGNGGNGAGGDGAGSRAAEPGVVQRKEGRLAGLKIWLVGASSGIGAALAGELADRGATLAITARREEALRATAGGRMAVVPADATDAEQIVAAADHVRQAIGGIDMVIWCAGLWQRFDVAAWDREAFAQQVETNLLGANNLLAAVLPEMVSRRSGHIVGIASVAGYRGLAGAEAYGATKAAQINLFEAMRGGLHRYGIQVTTVCPGFVDTPMTRENTFKMPWMVEAGQAARTIADGLARGRMEIVFPLRMAVTMKIARLLPVRVWAMISRRLAAAESR